MRNGKADKDVAVLVCFGAKIEAGLYACQQAVLSGVVATCVLVVGAFALVEGTAKLLVYVVYLNQAIRSVYLNQAIRSDINEGMSQQKLLLVRRERDRERVRIDREKEKEKKERSQIGV